MIKRSLYIIILIALPQFIQAQNQCIQNLDNARTLFNDGHFYDIPPILEECLNRGFTREQRIQAYHLLTISYLYMDKHKLAEEAYMKLLELDPEYDVENENDKIEIVYLDNKFRTTPIFTLTARGGLNLTSPYIIHDYDLNQRDMEKYESKYGFNLGPGIDLSIDNNFKVGVELMYRRTVFFYENNVYSEFDKTSVNQIQHWVSLPASVKYVRNYKNLYPYVYGGVVYDYLIHAKGNFTYNNITDNQGNFSIEEPIDLTNIRSRFNLNLMGGVGVKKRIGYYYLFVEFRFLAGLKNFIKSDRRYPLDEDGYLYDFEALYRYSYLDDDMRLNNFGFSIGFEKPFYKPRKITNGGSFIRRIFN